MAETGAVTPATAVAGLISAARAQAPQRLWSVGKRGSLADRQLLLQAQGEGLSVLFKGPSGLLLIVKGTEPRRVLIGN